MITSAANIELIAVNEYYVVQEADATYSDSKFVFCFGTADVVDKASIESYIRNTFEELAKKWREETGGSSSPLEKIVNDNYLMIIKKGVQHKEIIVSMILKELKREPNFWFKALRLITEEDPVKPEEFTSYKLVTKAWLNWGKEKGYL